MPPGRPGTTARLVALLPDDPAAWREHAAISGATGQYEAAKAIYDEALTRFPEDAELFRGRSIVNVRLGQLEAAAADATEAASLAPGWLEPRFLLGDIERARGQATAAEEAFRAALALNADHWPSLVNLAALRLGPGPRRGGDTGATGGGPVERCGGGHRHPAKGAGRAVTPQGMAMVETS